MDSPIVTLNQLGHLLQEVRSQRGLTQRQLGQRAGFAQSAISALESNPAQPSSNGSSSCWPPWIWRSCFANAISTWPSTSGSVKLQCCMNEVPVGVWQFGQRAADQFSYDEHWLQARHRRPLSLSMPTRSRPYRGQVVTSFFDNLLPELPAMRDRLAARLNTGDGPGDLLTELGRDCAGAVQLYPEGMAPSTAPRVSGVPLQPKYLERFLKVVPRSPILRCLRQHFRVALAGTNEKTALLYYQDQWRFPTHSTATTHIFKLASAVRRTVNENRTVGTHGSVGP